MLNLYVKLKTLTTDESGATIVEYGVALIVVLAAAAGGIAAVGGDVAGQFTAADGLMGGAAPADGGGG